MQAATLRLHLLAATFGYAALLAPAAHGQTPPANTVPASGAAAQPASGAAAQPVSVQPAAVAPSNALEQVVVTARKRQEKLFDVPGSVSAISSKQIETLRLRSARDFLTLIPSAYLDESDNSGGEKNFSIRGVSTPNIFAEPGVALYVDDVFSNGFISYPLQLHDINRIEVERGPQGALYGRDAVGGAVNVISNAPAQTYSAGATATYASHNRVELDAFANLPLSDKVQVRLAAWGVNQPEGEYYNKTLHQYLDATDYAGGRAVFAVEATDQLHFSFLVEHTQGNTAGTYLYFPQFETKTTLQRDTEPTNNFNVTRYMAKAQYDADFGQFSLIVGGREFQLTGVEDTDLSAIFKPDFAKGFDGKEVTNRQNSVSDQSVELRFLSHQFGPVNVLAGIVYLNANAIGDIQTDLPGLAQFFHAPFTLDIDNNQSLESIAGYAEATYTIVPGLDLIGDVRYTRDQKSDQFAFVPSTFAGILLGKGQTANPSKEFYRFSPGGTLAWLPGPDTRLYAKIQTGFRAGGYNFNVGNVKDLPYNQETSENYEIGAKQKFLDGQAYIAVTGYLLRQHNTLVSAVDPTQPGPLCCYLINAGQSRTYGAEAEASYTPFSGLQLTTNVGYADAQFYSGDATVSGETVPLAGRPVPGVRKWTFALTGNYRHPLTDRVDFLANASYTRRNGAFFDLSDTLKYDPSDLINLSTGLAFGRYDARIFVQNVLDNDYRIAYGGFRATASGAGVSGIERAEGRTIGGTVDVRF